MDCKVDFIARFPEELLLIIFLGFSTEELATASIVSPTWQNRLAQCHQLWRTFTLNQDNESSWLMIPNVGEHVKKLFYCPLTARNTCVTDTKTKIKERVKEYIREKEINQVYHSQVNTSYIQYRFSNALPITVILDSFPNMIWLELIHYSSDKLSANLPAKNTPASIQHQHVTTLKLRSSNKKQYEADHILGILRLCPAIRRLSVSCCNFSTLQVVTGYPNLEVVELNHGRNSSDTYTLGTLCHRILSEESPESTAHRSIQQGMRSLAIQVLESGDYTVQKRDNIVGYDISAVIIPNAHSLQEFIFDPDIPCFGFFEGPGDEHPIKNAIQWDLILSTKFNNLQRLRCVIPFTKERQFAAMISQHCPNLMDCSIAYDHDDNDFIPSVVLDALSEKPMLRRLILTFNSSSIETPAFKRLLDRNYQGRNRIRHLSFQDCRNIPNNVLNTLALTKHTLRGIEFNGSCMEWTGFDMVCSSADRCSSTIEWVIYSDAEYTEEDSFESFMLGETFKFEEMKLKTLRKCTAETVHGSKGALVKRDKHQEFAHDLLTSWNFASNIISNFLHHQLELP